MKSILVPNPSSTSLTMTVERHMKAQPEELYKAWTEKFDSWFAEPGAIIMTAEIDRPWFFYNKKDWGYHAHYGRFLELEKNKLVVTTWLTELGTNGTETVVKVELIPQNGGTLLRLTHSGFSDEKSRKGHADNWPAGLEHLDETLSRVHA